jgi:spoIIIJ-associated protein
MLKIREYEGKEKDTLLENALEELGVKEEDVLYYVTSQKVGLLKKEVFTLHLTTNEDIVAYVKEYLADLTKDMGLEVSFETKIRDNQLIIKMYSDNNNILIGKGGQTLKALTTVVKQVIYNQINAYPHILLDVENYKEKQEGHLERLAKRIAREVGRTKVEVALENMNSYERRIIHNVLTDNKYVYTESVGEEPNRHVVIKPKED